MKINLKLTLTLFLLMGMQQAPPDLPDVQVDPWLLGTWKYIGYKFEGEQYPPLDPKLELQFQFDADAVSTLRWTWTGETAFCERKAYYESIYENRLKQTVFWIHPDNHISCGKDQEMQLGFATLTPYQVEENMLVFYLELNGKPFLYLLEKVPAVL